MDTGPTPKNLSNVLTHPDIPAVSTAYAREYIEEMLKELCLFSKQTGQRDMLAFLSLAYRAIRECEISPKG